MASDERHAAGPRPPRFQRLLVLGATWPLWFAGPAAAQPSPSTESHPTLDELTARCVPGTLVRSLEACPAEDGSPAPPPSLDFVHEAWSTLDAADPALEQLRPVLERWLAPAAGGAQAALDPDTGEQATALLGAATRLNREAVGTAETPGTNDAATLALAARLYALFLERFGDPASPTYYDGLAPPGTSPPDSYDAAHAWYWAAELWWRLERWEACAAAFDRALALAPGAAFGADAVYGALLCHDKLLRPRLERCAPALVPWIVVPGSPRPDADAPPLRRALTEDEQRADRAAERYVCSTPDAPDVAGALRLRAQLRLAAGQVPEAAALFAAQLRREPEASTAPDAWLAAARSCAQTAVFDAAAEAYERFAMEFATGLRPDPRTGAAAKNALELWVALGRADRVVPLLERFDRQFAVDAAMKRAAAQIDFALGELLARDDRTEEALARFAAFVERRGEEGGRDLLARATVHAAALHFALGNCPAGADRRTRLACDEHRARAWEYAGQAVESADLPTFDEPEAAAASTEAPARTLADRRDRTWNGLLAWLALQVEAEGETARQILTFVLADKVAHALAQALFLLGEREFEAFQAETLRPFVPSEWRPAREACTELGASPASRASCLMLERYRQWTVEVLMPFAREREQAIQRSRRCYDRLAYLQAPAWEVAAARRVGDMYRRFHEDLDAAADRSELERALGVEVFPLYRQQVDAVLAPLRQQAIEAWRYAVTTARREQVWGEHAAAAEAALTELEPGAFPLPREVWAGPFVPAVQFAVPDLDPGVAAPDAAARGLSVPAAVPGVSTVAADGRFRFWPAPSP